MWRCRERGKRIGTASFGADSSDKSSFFTGKPYIEDLGYAFLFRNYRADLGKWQMRDLIGYPDGWNNLAYCGNIPNYTIDLFGAYMGWDDVLVVCGGALLGGTIQIVTNIVIGTNWTEGVLQAATTGAVAAETFYYAGPVAAAAAGAATNAMINMGTDVYNGNSINGTEIITNTIVDFSSSLAASGLIPSGSIPGRNSITALSKQILTKFKNETINDAKTITKIKTLIGNIIKDAPPDVVDRIFNEIVNRLRNVE